MTLSRGRTRARPWRRLGALVTATLLLLSGCYTTTARDHQANSPDTRPYFCNAVGDGTPIGGHGNGNHVHPIYEGMTKGELSWEDCEELGSQFDELLAAVSGLETREAAEADGWLEVAHYIPGLGTHHAKVPAEGEPGSELPRFGDSTFEAAAPEFLIYGSPEPDAPLVGVAYAMPGPDEPPEAFAGTNDWWHLHEKICLGPDREILAGAEEIPDEECAELGGRQIELGPGIWLLHLWIVPDYQLRLDVFASGHPCLGETGPVPRDDSCWDLTTRDPADGLPPGHGDHGSHDDHGS
jgi:hypothetical protein